jgi:hypothetical protein
MLTLSQQQMLVIEAHFKLPGIFASASACACAVHTNVGAHVHVTTQ